jgi:hypothetical protein
MVLHTQSDSIQAVCYDNARGRIIVISSAGVDVFRKTDGTRIAWASIPNCTCGAVNDHGVWIGTSDAGIYLLPHAARDAGNSDLILAYTTETTVALPNIAITGLAAVGGLLVAAHGAGVSFFPTRSWVYNCTISGGADAVALTDSQIAYAAADQIYIGTIQYADWATTAHTNLSGAGTVAALAMRGSVLFVAGVNGLYTYGGSTLNALSTDIGSAAPTAIWPTENATETSGYLAFGTNDGLDGGQFGIIDLGYSAGTLPDESGDTSAVWLSADGASWAWDTTVVNGTDLLATVSGDVDAVWLDDALAESLRNVTVEKYKQVAGLSPAANASQVRRDWTLYAEITDTLGGIEPGSIALTVNGQAVTPTTEQLDFGFAVSYTPGSNSGYAERVSIELSGLDADGNTVSKTWTFVTAAAPAATVTDSTPPNVVCTRDIGLEGYEADETVGGVNVVWLEDIAGPLIVTDAQAVAVGTVAIDEVTYHKHIRKMNVPPIDANGLQTRTLRKGQVATMTCPAIGMTAQKCEVLAAQRKLDDDNELTFDLQIAYYEQVQA